MINAVMFRSHTEHKQTSGRYVSTVGDSAAGDAGAVTTCCVAEIRFYCIDLDFGSGPLDALLQGARWKAHKVVLVNFLAFQSIY